MSSSINEEKDNRKDVLIEKMTATKKKLDEETLKSEEGPDETDTLLSKAIEMALEQGKGWKEGEREAYIEKLMDDDYLHPLFATDEEDLKKSGGMAEAFSSLLLEDGESPAFKMEEYKKKGNDAFTDGKKNVAKNVQYYRDAINHYYQAIFWAEKVDPDIPPPTDEDGNPLNDTPNYTVEELNDYISTLHSNAAMAHMHLKNWGYVRDESKKSISHNKSNVKAWYRLARAYHMLQNWEDAGDAIDSGLLCDAENKDLIKLQKLLEKKVRKARLERQKRQRTRAERVSRVKKVWKYCKETGIQLGRVPLVSSVADDDDEQEEGNNEARWHQHHPHTGKLPQIMVGEGGGEWSWPCMFVYPSHHHSDFIESFCESEMLALRMAQVFPEIDEDGGETDMAWDYNNEFECSKLAVYFEVHCTDDDENVIHPEFVERLKDQGATMKFYESSRALKGDEGPDMAHLARCVERKHLHKQRQAWKKKHGSLWAKPDPCPVMRVHPAATLKEILEDKRMVVPNFLVTFLIFPENHPAHNAFLSERQCLGILESKRTA